MSADQEWSDAIKAGIGNLEELHSSSQQDIQADFLPTSSQSPGNSPQPSPDSQQRELTPVPSQSPLAGQQQQQSLKNPPQSQQNYGSQQDQHISQSDVPPPNTSQNYDQAGHSEKISMFEGESQQVPDTQALQAPGQVRSTQNVSKNNNSSAKPSPRSQNFSTKGQPHLQDGNFSNAQMHSNVSHQLPNRHTHSQPVGYRPVRHSQPYQSPQQRPAFNMTSGPRQTHGVGISSPPRLSSNNQNIKPNAQRFQQPHNQQQNCAGGQQKQQQNIRASGPSSTGGNVGLIRMPSPNLNTQKVRPQNGGPRSGQPRTISSNQSQGQPRIQNQAIRPSGQMRPGFNRGASQSGNRMPSSQGHSGPSFPNRQQGIPQQRQSFVGGMGMPEMSNVHHPDFEDEEMYDEDDEDDEDYDEDMDEDDMYPPGFQGVPGYDYPSSDNDELSEEEASLLEELSCCQDEERYEEIVSRLREKGVDPDEIDEMMYNSNNFSQGLYPEDDFFNEDGEETVSSSSQGQMTFQQSQSRLQSQTGVSPSSGTVHSQPGMSTASSPQQGTAPGSVNVNTQGAVSKAPAASSCTPSQQTKNISPHVAQKQQPVPATRPPGQNPSVPLPQIQPQLKLAGQTNPSQHRKVFQSSPSQGQPSSQASGWQPLQNIVRTQSPQVQQEQTKQSISTRPPSQSDQHQGLQAPRPALANRSPQQMSQGQSNTVRAQGQTQPTSAVGRPNQQLTPIGGSNQGQQVQNQQFFARQPGQQMVLNTSSNQHSGYGGMQGHVQPPMVRSARPRMPFQMQQRPFGQGPQNMANNQMMAQSGQRHFRPRNQNPGQPNVNSPRLKAEPNKETAPSKARLARLAVMHMQQSLDEEIKAKKGGPPQPNQPSGQQVPRGAAPGGQQFQSQTRFPPQQQPGQFIQGLPNQTVGPQQFPNQTFPSMYQPKQQLSPRQPIPGVMNPSSSTNQALSGGRPICSVVPFTSQNRGPATPSNSQKPNTPQQNVNFPRPRNPSSLSPQSFSGPQHTSTVNQNRMTTPVAQQSSQALPTAAAPVIRNPTPVSNVAQSQSQVTTQSDSQQQQPCSKAETFSLDRLSEDKCIVTSKTGKRQGLVTNMVYQIRSPIDQSLVLALWNGEHFEDLKQKDVRGQSSSGTVTVSQAGLRATPDSQLGQTGQNSQTSQASEKEKIKGTPSAAPGVNSSKFQAKFLQSLTRKTDQEEQSWSNPESTPSSSQDVNTEPGQGSNPSPQKGASDNQSTYVKPLNQGPLKKEEPMEDEDDDSLFKKPYNENEDFFRVCNNCGYTSKNFKRCEGCKKIFQGQVKIHSTKKNVGKNVASTSGKDPNINHNEENSSQPGDPYSKVMNNISFYRNHPGRGKGRGARGGSGRTRGGGLKGRMGMRGNQGEDYDSSDSDESSVDGKGNSDASRSSVEGQGKRRPARPKGKNPTPRKRSKKMDEPVTVTISSDEDEPSSTSNNLPFHTASPAHSAGSESPIFPSTPAEPVNAFGRFRRALMEDEEGNSKLGKKMQQRLGAPPMEREEEEEEDEDDDDDGDEPPIYEIDIRSVRIGSMRTQPEGALLINLRGVCFKVRSERTEEAFECEILCQEVEHVKYFSGQTQPVLFLFLTQECGEKLRKICQMEPGDDEYFDPSATDMKQKMVVIIIECFNYMPQDMLRETLSLWADMNHAEDEYFIEELTEESANDLLIQSAPPVLTADVERDIVKFKNKYLRDSNDLGQMSRKQGSPLGSTDNEPDSTSSSPPEIKHHHHHHFMGSSVRLLQYPPAPARGIPITTEDLLCLSEGEFLNDVIIDFYLQYLYEEKLSEENRKRTHIFSSFFYKRLTQRDRHSEKTEEDAKKSLPERRHARVKKWTKTVDLFSKDFIIVPINEHSHWYLAVICFPGLATPEVVPFIPATSNKTEAEEEHTDAGASDEGASEESGNQESLVKTILGKQLDPKKCLDNEESKYNLGHKQPCILMFDSLAGPTRNPNVKMLREYLQCEWNAKKSESRQIAKILRGSTPKVPQQSNYSDCGVYLLQYVESFFENPIADFQIPMKGLLNWFPEELVLNKRCEIHELIMSLHRRFQEERGDPRVLDIKFESTPREPPMRFSVHPEQNLKSEDGPGSGIGRDDESSNSSMSGDMGKAEFRSATQPFGPVPMDENSEENFEDQNEEQHGDDSQEADYYDQELHSGIQEEEEEEQQEEYADAQEDGNGSDQ